MRKLITISASLVFSASLAIGVAAVQIGSSTTSVAAVSSVSSSSTPTSSSSTHQAAVEGHVATDPTSNTAADHQTPAADLFSSSAPDRGAASDIPLSANAYSGNTQVADTSISCDGYLHTVDFDVKLLPLNGFSSQTAAYRVYVYSYTSGVGTWLPWQSLTAPGEVIDGRDLPFEDGTNRYAMYVAYSWFTGSAWTSPVGAWVTTYTHKDLFGYWDEGFCEA